MKSQIHEEASRNQPDVRVPRHREVKTYSPVQLFLKKFKKQSMAVAALWVLIAIFLLGLAGPWITPFDPNRSVTEQYAEKGIDRAKGSMGVIHITGKMSDGTERPVTDLTLQSANRQIALASEDNGAISVTPIGQGSTTVLIAKGNISAQVKVDVSVADSPPIVTQLVLRGPTGIVKKGDSFRLELEAVLSNGEKLVGWEQIQSKLKQSLGTGTSEKGESNGFLTGKKKTDAEQVRIESMNDQVLRVSPDGTVTALGSGSSEVKASLGLVSTIVPIAVDTMHKEPMLVQLVADQPKIALHDSSKHQPPSMLHWFGTDHQNRDIFSRVLAGTRETLFIGFVSVGMGAVIGTLLGLLAGYYGRWVDSSITRLTDILLAFPGILLAIAVIAVLGAGMTNIIFAVAVFTVPIFIRIVRGSTLSLKQMTYVEAAKSIGVQDAVIIMRHILPGMLPVVMVYLTMRIGTAILLGAALSFLGLGGDITAPEWGAMLSAAKDNSRNLFYPTFFPGIAIVLTVVSFNLLGDGLRDTLDPKLKE
ncbi:ABC transporter permease subunit [Brevibacillus fluminis]|uniref:Glutathione transport system permease protein GsiD n=1 Tax=Brevibacillus fluminis TaxID=511487 RepID=A0A3M8DHX1_9BACL|nr:ABC transporter permease subunit [Brevibacillus fluminis]RNB86965.1 ABC transporter permease subunit [Brevibacillus fluminis]